MAKNTARGNSAYNEVRRNGGTKQQAKEASIIASNLYYEKVKQSQFGNIKPFDNNVSDFNNPINNGSWHTSENL